MEPTLVVTNDFPPRIGGIESFVADVCGLLNDEVLVYTAAAPGSAGYDASRSYPVVRDRGPLLPTRRTAGRAADLLRDSGATRVVFGAAAPLALMTPVLRAAGAERVVALTHGHEVWWARVPGARELLRRIGDDVDHLTVISAFTRDQIAPVLSTRARSRLLRVPPPVDTAIFRPDPSRPESLGSHRPRCVAVGRLVAQKGFATLLRSWRLVLERWTGSTDWPELVVVGDGPQRDRLLRLGRDLGLDETVTWAGARPRSEVVAVLQSGDVFAAPVRTRLRGLNPEGLGLAALEAAACGLPVVVGDSGGAPETVRPGETGFVVDPDDVDALADRLLLLLGDLDLAGRLGSAGRDHVVASFGPAAVRTALLGALALDPHPRGPRPGKTPPDSL
jgi:phosphatidylinositol alpha-1,6-mannosyltransferase